MKAVKRNGNPYNASGGLSQAAALEAACFGSDAWSEQALEQALSDKNALYLSCMEEGRLDRLLWNLAVL